MLRQAHLTHKPLAIGGEPYTEPYVFGHAILGVMNYFLKILLVVIAYGMFTGKYTETFVAIYIFSWVGIGIAVIGLFSLLIDR